MKKLHLWLLAAVAFVCAGFQVQAQEYVIHVKWDNPGALSLKKGYTQITLDPSATSYDYVADSEWASNLVLAGTNGYLIETVTCEETGEPVSKGYSGYSLSMSTYKGKTIVVTTAKPTIDSHFKVTIPHSPEIVQSITLNGTNTDLSGFNKGENVVEFASAADNNISIVAKYGEDPVTGAANNRKFYSIKKNGTDISSTYNIYSNVYKNIPVADGDEFEIIPFENAPAGEKGSCTVTYDLPTGIDVIKTVFNRTTSSFISNPFDAQPITVEEGTVLQFNLNTEDINYTQIKIGDTTFDCEQATDNGYVRYTAGAEDVTLTIRAAVKEYGTTTWTFYIENPEGLDIWAGNMATGVQLDLSNGTDAADFHLNSNSVLGQPAYTMTNVKKFEIPVSTKYSTVMWREKAGYWIYQSRTGATAAAEIPCESTTIYLVARPIQNDAKTLVYYAGTPGAISLKANAKFGANITHPLDATGYVEVEFDSAYEPDFSIKSGTTAIQGVYLDGSAVSKDENEQYSGIKLTGSTVLKIYADGRASVKSSTLTFASQNGGSAAVTYDRIKTLDAIPATFKALDGTEVTITPTEGTSLFINDTFTALDENGSYSFVTKGGSNYAVTLAVPAQAEITTLPADGETVKNLSQIVVSLPVSGELMFNPTETFNDITVADAEGNLAGFYPGEPAMNDTETSLLFPIVLESPIVAAGQYTITVPAGAFAELGWDDASEGFVPAPASRINAQLTATVTVDPAFKAPIDYVRVTPANGHALKKIDAAYIDFTKYAAYDMIQTPTWGLQAYFTYEDGTEYDAEIQRNWNNPDCCSFTAVPVDENGDPVILDAEGTVTLWIKEGTFSINGNKSETIEAEYTIHPTHPTYPITPVHGTTVTRLNKATIVFPGVTEASFNASAAITLTAQAPVATAAVNTLATTANFTATAKDVTPGETANEFHITFDKAPSLNGNYTITVPAGAFTLDDEDSEEAAATFTYQQEWTLTPEPGDTPVDNLGELILSFPSATSVERTDAADDEIAFRAIDNSWAPSRITIEEVTEAPVPTYSISFSPAPTQIKTYSLYIPEGFFLVDGEASQEIDVNYTLANNTSDIEYQFTPESTILLTDWANFGISFSEIHTVTLADADKISVTNNGNPVDASDYMTMAEGNYFIVMITNTGAFEDGTLTLDLGEGALNVTGMTSPAINHTWNLVSPKEYTITVDPATDEKEVSSLEKVTLTIEGATTATIQMAHGISLVSQDYSSYPFTNGTITEVEGAEIPTFEVSFPKPTVVTAYTLTVNYGTFLIDGVQENERTTFTYNNFTSGIDAIDSDANGKQEIFNLQGIRINASWDELPAGLYFLNGVKTIKK